MLSRNREMELSELAEYIADYYCPDSIVDPSNIANMKGISHCYGQYGKAFDGLIEQENGKFHIYINVERNAKGSHRARFTFAHELGHYFIDEHRQALLRGQTPSHPSFTNFSSKNIVEMEADHFAACLLLPESRIKRDCTKRPFNFQLVSDISQKYQTSITASVIRLMTIDKHPIMLVCCVNGRIKWFKYSHDFPFKTLKKPFGNVPKNTLAGSYFSTGEKFDDELPVTANDWFEFVSDRHLDREFFEKCIYSDQHKFVLSIVWER